MKIAKRCCHAKATVAVARKLATVMHAMWRDGTCYAGDHGLSDADAATWMKEKLARVNYARSGSTHATQRHDRRRPINALSSASAEED